MKGIELFFIIGNYFGSHFIMGGERFDTPQPESYLFGENSDLNFLGSKPTPVCIASNLLLWLEKFHSYILVSISSTSAE